MVAIGEFGLTFVLPLFLVNVLALTSLQAGFVLATMALGAFGSGAAARHLAAAIGAPLVIVLGLGLEVAGLVVVAFILDPAISPWVLALTLVIYGVGLGLAAAQLTSTTLSQVPEDQSGQGSAAQSTLRQVGSALGTALIGTALSVALATTVPASLDDISGLSPGSVDHLTTATAQSAGGVIAELGSEGAHSQFGPATPDIVTALDVGFADATRTALPVAGAFLLVGLAFSTLVVVVARRRDGESTGATTLAARTPSV